MELALSFITAIFVGGIAGFLGSLLITERMALVGGPLGHMALPGVAIALVYGVDIFWGALAAIAFSAFLIWILSLKSQLPLETLTAVVFAATVSLGFLILPIEEAEGALIGDITRVNSFDAVLAIVLALGVFIVVKNIYSKMVLAGISKDLAKSRGVNVKKYNFIYLIAIALVVVVEVKIVGILLTSALMALPAAAASNFSRTLGQYTYLALFIGVFGAVLGMILFVITGLPAGPLIVLTSAFVFFVSLFFKRS